MLLQFSAFQNDHNNTNMPVLRFSLAIQMIVLNISREFCWPKGRLPRKTVEMILCLPTLVLAQCTVYTSVHKCIIFKKKSEMYLLPKKSVSLQGKSVLHFNHSIYVRTISSNNLLSDLPGWLKLVNGKSNWYCTLDFC